MKLIFALALVSLFALVGESQAGRLFHRGGCAPQRQGLFAKKIGGGLFSRLGHRHESSGCASCAAPSVAPVAPVAPPVSVPKKR